MLRSLYITVHAYRGVKHDKAELRVTGVHTDGSEESFAYPLPDPRCLDIENVDDWAKELLVQAIEQL